MEWIWPHCLEDLQETLTGKEACLEPRRSARVLWHRGRRDSDIALWLFALFQFLLSHQAALLVLHPAALLHLSGTRHDDGRAHIEPDGGTNGALSVLQRFQRSMQSVGDVRLALCIECQKE